MFTGLSIVGTWFLLILIHAIYYPGKTANTAFKIRIPILQETLAEMLTFPDTTKKRKKYNS
jgi:Na+-transporting methylmalonyl-CoA/oxaloacetate decarboxylase gamma subunit